MTLPRRRFLAGLASATLVPPLSLSAQVGLQPSRQLQDRFDPWLEVDPGALRVNVLTIARLTSQRRILAVVKNNAYGLGLTTVAALLEPMREIHGFAVVKTEAALALRAAGIQKPVLLMGMISNADAAELVRQDIQLAITTEDSPERALRGAVQAGRPAKVQVYLDTGMSRMGVRYQQAGSLWDRLDAPELQIMGTFTAFTEDPEFDVQQLGRFRDVARSIASAGGAIGDLHAASSNAVFNFRDAHLDLVRPGIALYGAYPSDFQAERQIAALEPAVRLRARVVRVEQLQEGDGVSYGRNYVAQTPTWIATLPAGHTDGVPREAVEGARVLIDGRVYPVIGAVSASHTIIELGSAADGAQPPVRIGQVATLLGPDHPDIHPNAVAAATGRSVYDVLMHLNPELPKVVV